MGRGMDLKERATSEKSDFQKVGLLKGGGGGEWGVIETGY